jgi:hypothetical protein
MKIDRLLFLSLATSLSAMACSSAADPENDTDEGAVSLAQCKAPGAEMAKIVDTQATFCADFSDRPRRRAITTRASTVSA